MPHRALLLRLKEHTRTVAFVVFVLLMVGGPFYKQVLGGETILLREWTMYSGLGLRVCDVAFYIQEADGHRMPVDRYEVLGYAAVQEAPIEVRRLEGAAGVLAVAHKMQEALGDDKDLRVDARIATPVGWVPLFEGKAVDAASDAENRRQP
ncbi:MAG TPA: hypothetical protein VKP65_25195 [Rhodothermales bacterium]|nr:hypothetical protein [Rhodothermales bacterium]